MTALDFDAIAERANCAGENPDSLAAQRDSADDVYPLLLELDKFHRGDCVCAWAPEGDGESGYVAEPLPYCPQHGERAQASEASWNSLYDRMARAVDVDPAEPFPEVDVFEEALRRLGAPDPEIGRAKSGFIHPLIHVNVDGLCGFCEIPLSECAGSCRGEELR